VSTWPFIIVGELDDIVPGRVLVENGELCATVLLALTPIGNTGCDTGTDADVDKPSGPTWNDGWIPGAVVAVKGAAAFWIGNSGWCDARPTDAEGTGRVGGGNQGWGRALIGQLGGGIPIWAAL